MSPPGARASDHGIEVAANVPKIHEGPSLATTHDMALERHLSFFLASCFLLGCTGRSTDVDSMTTAADGDGDGDGDGTAGDGDDPTATSSGDGGGTGDGGDASTSADGGSATDDGPAPACTGDVPWCLSDGVGTCPHSPGTDALCEGADWVCPEGYNFEEDLICTPEGKCEGAGCPIPCQQQDSPPPGFEECWDQGPGKCADATAPSFCADDGTWSCPNGYDFGGFGEGCTFPGE